MKVVEQQQHRGGRGGSGGGSGGPRGGVKGEPGGGGGDSGPEKVRMSLEDRDLWSKFKELTNEMIVTKSGRWDSFSVFHFSQKNCLNVHQHKTALGRVLVGEGFIGFQMIL